VHTRPPPTGASAIDRMRTELRLHEAYYILGIL
jgi:hypothetical protein